MADIAIRKVFKSYGKEQVVHGVDLSVPNGEFIVILGPSGCGKSTLLRMIAGLEAISDGEISIGGRVVNDLEPRDRGCAMVFQNYALYPHMSVANNIGYGLKVAGMPKAERLEKVRGVAKILGLEEFLERKPGQLSGGQRQRVAMGRAIIREPKVFLFDEPLSNLDAKLRVQMRLEIRRLHNRLGATSVFVTHDQVEAMTLADRLVVMNSGHIEQVGSPSEIYNTPASVYVASFIGSPPMNILPGEVSRDTAQVRIGHGVANLPVDPVFAQQNAGRLVQVGIRPEAVRLATHQGEVDLTARFEFFEELGNGRLWHLTLDDLEFILLTSETHVPQTGEAIALHVPAEAIHVFDGQEGRRIDGRAAPVEARVAEPA